MRFVADTNVLMDMTKPDGAADVPADDLEAARAILVCLLAADCEHSVAYSKGMIAEWNEKGLLREDVAYVALRHLVAAKRMVLVDAIKLSGGQSSSLAAHVDRDDQVFVLTAAALDEDCGRRCVTRDPKTSRASSRRYVARQWKVAVKRAAEFAEELDVD